jgi:hypothetical protein
MDYDRLLETAMREFERKVVSLVEREFERVCEAMQRGEECEIPVIGGEFLPPDYRAGLQERVMRALCARRWFEFEAPLWAQPLPLRNEDCIACFNPPHPTYGRRWLVGEYGVCLRSMDWHYERATPFEKFCQHLAPPP